MLCALQTVSDDCLVKLFQILFWTQLHYNNDKQCYQ